MHLIEIAIFCSQYRRTNYSPGPILAVDGGLTRPVCAMQRGEGHFREVKFGNRPGIFQYTTVPAEVTPTSWGLHPQPLASPVPSLRRWGGK
jgi:hypothetical protein